MGRNPCGEPRTGTASDARSGRVDRQREEALGGLSPWVIAARNPHLRGDGVARLTESEVDVLLDQLDPGVHATQSADVVALRRKLTALTESGSLAPLIAKALAGYVNRPIRSGTQDAATLGREHSAYVGERNGIAYRLTLDALLVSSLADAMIGGEGEAAKVGSGSKVALVASGAAKSLLGAIASALDVAPPLRVRFEGQVSPAGADAGGSLGFGSQMFSWHLSLSVPALAHAPSVERATPGAPPDRAKARGELDVPAALEEARVALEGGLRATVTFEGQRIERLTTATPAGWLRLGILIRQGGAIVASVDRPSAAALIDVALGNGAATGENMAMLAETGVEVLVTGALRAFVAALPQGAAEAEHVMRLGDDAILAALPHHRIVTNFHAGKRTGRLIWLVPSSLLSVHA